MGGVTDHPTLKPVSSPPHPPSDLPPSPEGPAQPGHTRGGSRVMNGADQTVLVGSSLRELHRSWVEAPGVRRAPVEVQGDVKRNGEYLVSGGHHAWSRGTARRPSPLLLTPSGAPLHVPSLQRRQIDDSERLSLLRPKTPLSLSLSRSLYVFPAW